MAAKSQKERNNGAERSASSNCTNFWHATIRTGSR